MSTEDQSGQRTWMTEDRYCPGPTDFPVLWNQRVRVLRVSTVSSPKLKTPDDKRRVRKAIGQEHVFIDDGWLDQFLGLCRAAGNPTSTQIVSSLMQGKELVSSEVMQLNDRTQRRLRKWWQPQHQRFQLTFVQSRTQPTLKLDFEAKDEESIKIIYWYTLQDPPVYQRVSKILNHPTVRVSDPEKMQAVIPFAKGLMNAIQQVQVLHPCLWYSGPAWRGVGFQFSDEQWLKYQPGVHVCWYTVKSLTSTHEALETFVGKEPFPTIFEVVNCSGVKVRAFSEFDGEDEVLLMPGVTFKVISAERSQSAKDPQLWNRADLITLQMVA